MLTFAAAGSAASGPPSLTALDPKVVSYFPATGGWTTMWEDWDPAAYNTDFAKIAGLDANTVRVIVPVDLFGFPVPRQPYVGRLRQLVAIAASHGLKVQLTLFDWFHDGGYADIAGSERWVSSLLSPYAGDRRISFVEVRNELDTSDPTALAWARQLIPDVRAVLGGSVPVTISVAGGDPVASLQTLKGALAGAEPDFYTIHYYGGGGEQAYWTLQAAQAVAAPEPLWLGETGYPTSSRVTGYSDVPLTRQAQEGAQAHFLKTIAYAAFELGLPPPGVWTLDDFDPGRIPTAEQAPTSEAEYHFGLFRTDGSPKPAAAVVRSIFGSSPPLGFDQGFEQAVRTSSGGLLPAEWGAFGSPNTALAQAGNDPRSGTGDALVQALSGRADGTFFAAPIMSTPPPGASAAVASVWVHVRSQGARVRVALQWLDGTDAAIGSEESPPPPPGPGWKELTVTGAPPDGARSVRIELTVGNSPGRVWFDDVGFHWAR
jgi:hypothetical protein